MFLIASWDQLITKEYGTFKEYDNSLQIEF